MTRFWPWTSILPLGKTSTTVTETSPEGLFVLVGGALAVEVAAAADAGVGPDEQVQRDGGRRRQPEPAARIRAWTPRIDAAAALDQRDRQRIADRLARLPS